MGGSVENRKGHCRVSVLHPTTASRPNSSPSILMVAVAIACLGVLLLPLEGESPSWPTYLHVTVNQKLIAAFALGKCTSGYIHTYVLH